MSADGFNGAKRASVALSAGGLVGRSGRTQRCPRGGIWLDGADERQQCPRGGSAGRSGRMQRCPRGGLDGADERSVVCGAVQQDEADECSVVCGRFGGVKRTSAALSAGRFGWTKRTSAAMSAGRFVGAKRTSGSDIRFTIAISHFLPDAEETHALPNFSHPANTHSHADPHFQLHRAARLLPLPCRNAHFYPAKAPCQAWGQFHYTKSGTAVRPRRPSRF